MSSKYPYQCARVRREQTLSFESQFFLAKSADGENPLEIYMDQEGLSRLKVTLITTDRKSLVANIPVSKMARIEEATMAATALDVALRSLPWLGAPQPVQTPVPPQTPAAETATAEETPSGKARTVILTVGEFAGKTPAAVLQADPANTRKMNTVYRELLSGLEQHPEYRDQLDAIREAAELLKNGGLQKEEPKPAEDCGDCSAAFAVRISNGSMKGKTPAEVLQEDPGAESKLESQRKWLAEHLAQYPKNQQQIDAIDAALRLKRAGQLTNHTPVSPAMPAAASGGVRDTVLYEAQYHVLKSKGSDSNGNSFVYDMKIVWEYGKDYPIVFTIANYWAPAEQDESGRYKVRASKAVNKLAGEMRLLPDEWANCLRGIKASMRQFEQLHAEECFRDAAQADAENRRKAAETKNGGSGR